MGASSSQHERSAELPAPERVYDIDSRKRLQRDVVNIGSVALLGIFTAGAAGQTLLHRPEAALLDVAPAFLTLGLIFLLRSGRWDGYASHGLVIVCLFGVVSDINFGGDEGRAFFPLLMLTPLLVGIVLDGWGPLLWTPILCGLAVDLTDLRLDLQPASNAAGEADHLAVFAAVLGIVSCSLAVGIFLFAQRRALDEAVDWSRRLRDEVEVRRAAEEAAHRANRTKSEFLATMSHEIRTPLNGVLGMAQLLQKSELPPEEGELAAVLHRSAESLLFVLNDILDLSKLEAGKVTLEQIPLQPKKLVTDAVAMVSSLAQQKGLELQADVGSELAAWVMGDPNRLRQILLNLLNNAIKFTEKGTITVRMRGKGSDRYRIEVNDPGLGIDEETRARLFLPFEQADASTTRRFGGTGLGLAICRHLVEAMEGVIGVSSGGRGKGSTFFFEVSLPEAEAPAAHEEGGLKRWGRDERFVLIVDDHPVNRMVAAKLLDRMGIAAVTTESGRGALEVVEARRTEISLVLMDVEMPGMDGLEVTRRIRDLEPSPPLPIVGLSANAGPEHRLRGLEAGMDDYLSKPIRAEELNACLAALLGGPLPGRYGDDVGRPQSHDHPARSHDRPRLCRPGSVGTSPRETTSDDEAGAP